MDFQREVPADLVEDVQDREPAPGEVLESGVPVGGIGGREGINAVPDTRTGKSRHGSHSKAGGGVGRVFHGLGVPLTHTLGIDVFLDFGRQDGAVARIDRITDSLADKVVADDEAAQVMLGKQGPLTLDISRVRQGGVHIEMIVRASQFQAVVAHLPSEECEFGQGNIGPLSGKQGNGAGHAPLPLVRKLNEAGMVLLDWERGGESRCL